MKRDWFCKANLLTALVLITAAVIAAVVAYATQVEPYRR